MIYNYVYNYGGLNRICNMEMGGVFSPNVELSRELHDGRPNSVLRK